MADTPEYALKRQPKIEMTDERIYFTLPWGTWWTSRKEHESDFVDRQALTEQVEEILYGTLGVNLNGDEISEKVMAERIVARLFGLGNTEET